MTAGNEPLLDVKALGAAIIDAARAALKKRGMAVQATAEVELRRLAGALVDVGALLAKGEIDPKRARKLVRIHQLAMQGVLRSIEGLTIAAAEETMRAVLVAAAGTINRVVGFELISKTSASFKAGKDL